MAEPEGAVVATTRELAGPAGNFFDKYHTRNPVYRVLVRRFLATVCDLARSLGTPSVLEVGCGEGHLARYLSRDWAVPPIVACDISTEVVRAAHLGGGPPRFLAADSYRLPFADGSFDLVMLCEVMEHLAEPRVALAEACRVARRACLLSVPREPLWRVLNLARGSYWRDGGNTPGHVQWWSRRAFLRLVSEHGRLLGSAAPLPWSVAHIAPHDPAR